VKFLENISKKFAINAKPSLLKGLFVLEVNNFLGKTSKIL